VCVCGKTGLCHELCDILMWYIVGRVCGGIVVCVDVLCRDMVVVLLVGVSCC